MFKKLITAAALTLVLQNAALAANDTFLKIEGVEGESLDAEHRDEIDVLAWSWGSSTNGRSTCVQDISLTKYADLASPQLLMGHVDGFVYPNAKLTVKRSTGASRLAYIVLDFKNLYVSSVSTGGSGGEVRITENVTLNFEEVKYQYTPQNADGSAGVPVSATIRPSQCK
ncbi:MAG: type VI secretion system tube protein Hcp [Gammaproteobacteria bacterium]|nr:type VI secretion system tube protein Hcp [Gammaproteobacteria bacterium]